MKRIKQPTELPMRYVRATKERNRTPRLFFALILVFTPLLALMPMQPNSAAAQASVRKITQRVVANRSTMKFVAQIGVFQLQGSFRSFSGIMILDPKSFSPTLVELTVDPSQVDVQGSQAATLLQTPDAKPAKFTSSSIRASGRDKFQVRGKVVTGKEAFAMEFVAHCPNRTPKSSYCEFKVSGPISALNRLGGLGNFGALGNSESSGTLEGKLTFEIEQSKPMPNR